jgi:hypothetical protein
MPFRPGKPESFIQLLRIGARRTKVASFRHRQMTVAAAGIGRQAGKNFGSVAAKRLVAAAVAVKK